MFLIRPVHFVHFADLFCATFLISSKFCSEMRKVAVTDLVSASCLSADSAQSTAQCRKVILEKLFVNTKLPSS